MCFLSHENCKILTMRITGGELPGATLYWLPNLSQVQSNSKIRVFLTFQFFAVSPFCSRILNFGSSVPDSAKHRAVNDTASQHMDG